MQEWVVASELKIVLNRINTFRDEVFGDPNVLRSYFYAISDLAVGGRYTYIRPLFFLTLFICYTALNSRYYWSIAKHYLAFRIKSKKNVICVPVFTLDPVVVTLKLHLFDVDRSIMAG